MPSVILYIRQSKYGGFGAPVDIYPKEQLKYVRLFGVCIGSGVFAYERVGTEVNLQYVGLAKRIFKRGKNLQRINKIIDLEYSTIVYCTWYNLFEYIVQTVLYIVRICTTLITELYKYIREWQIKSHTDAGVSSNPLVGAIRQ